MLSRAGFEVHLPRVHAECDYLVPVRFEDELLVHLLVRKKSSRSLTYLFRFYRTTGSARQEVACGQLVVVSAAVSGDGTMKAVSLPKVIAEQIQEAPDDLLADGSGKGKALHPIRQKFEPNN